MPAEFKQRAFCAQGYMPEIGTRGETSLVFLGGSFSRTVGKTAAPGGWLAHEFCGGINTPSAVAESCWATEIQELLASQYGRWGYARIDAIPVGGQPFLL